MGGENEYGIIKEVGELVNELFLKECERIKSELRSRCAAIPDDVWFRYYPNPSMPLGSHISSTVMPITLYGHDEIKTNLTREGKIIEILVHYATDGYDSEKQAPDEILGEAGNGRYLQLYQHAIDKLDLLKKEAA